MKQFNERNNVKTGQMIYNRTVDIYVATLEANNILQNMKINIAQLANLSIATDRVKLPTLQPW